MEYRTLTSDDSEAITSLCRDHLEGRISTIEYRARRRALIDRMDRRYNGFSRADRTDSERTQPRPGGTWARHGN
ncbi:hypothetical protein ACXYTJ_00480 [Gilvimarinus sp. F26214L]|uniref:hypothetical protein n=1 Tax=Gilvimarinus sp. DZF01 TaxID=3461371 RepID=UPI004045D1F4